VPDFLPLLAERSARQRLTAIAKLDRRHPDGVPVAQYPDLVAARPVRDDIERRVGAYSRISSPAANAARCGQTTPVRSVRLPTGVDDRARPPTTGASRRAKATTASAVANTCIRDRQRRADLHDLLSTGSRSSTADLRDPSPPPPRAVVDLRDLSGSKTRPWCLISGFRLPSRTR
jgi:hypothetical protein